MGLFWDLYQQSQISRQGERSGELEARVAALETALRQTQQLLQAVIERLEQHVGRDLDANGRVG
jgi:hypothetical protein